MKVKYKGVRVEGGCKCKGTRTTFEYKRVYYLPSGIKKTFRAGRYEEVSDEDGAFLLGLTEFET